MLRGYECDCWCQCPTIVFAPSTPCYGCKITHGDEGEEEAGRRAASAYGSWADTLISVGVLEDDAPEGLRQAYDRLMLAEASERRMLRHP